MEKLPISVLFVDDEKTLRLVYEKLIGNWVQKIYLASNGLEGYELYAEHTPDLVITDIRMPVMNGLDMTLMIRRQYPQARIIILSAYSEANFLIRAIEGGVKDFLIKPVDNHVLLKSITEQAEEIRLGRKMLEEESRRIKAEIELRHNEQVLQAVNETAAHFINFGYNDSSVQFVLHTLGTAARVSRVYFFQNFKVDGKDYCKQTHEWTANNIGSESENELLFAVPHTDISFARWASELSQRHIIHGLIRNFPIEEQAVLGPQNILSIVAIPVFVQKEWYGFIGFDDCVEERIWTKSEIDTLSAAANLFGSAIYRTSIANQLKTLNVELEERVKIRTETLEKEVAEHKITESLLRQSEEKYRSIFENANDAIFLCINTQIKLTNPRFFEFTGFSPEDVLGRSFLDFVSPDDHHYLLRRKEMSHCPNNTFESFDIKLITADASLKWVEIKSRSILWDGQQGFLSFLTDIHKRKLLENELRELNTNLEARVETELRHREKQQQLVMQKSKLESLGELSAGMAHEINQPLGGLSMSIDNILDELNSGKLDEEYLNRKFDLMFKDIERIRRIIEHVRIFSRDHQNTDFEVFNLSKVIQNSLLLVNKLFENNQIELRVNINDLECCVFGNPFQLEQVILNVLSNARHAVEKKQIESGSEYQKRVSIESFTEKDAHFINICDNGIGIGEEILGNVFNPFFTTKNADEGTGLGLSVSYGLVRSMNGNIEIESTKHEFTKVSIQIPLYTQ